MPFKLEDYYMKRDEFHIQFKIQFIQNMLGFPAEFSLLFRFYVIIFVFLEFWEFELEEFCMWLNCDFWTLSMV